MHRRRSWPIASFLLGLLVVSACTTPRVETGVLGVRIDAGERELAVGSTLALSANVAVAGGASPEVAWSSHATATAAVDASGVVTGVSVGGALVTATSVFDPAKFDVVTVHVREARAVESVTINETDLTLAVGSTADFTVSVVAVGGASTAVTWSSSAADVAAVTAAGRVEALAVGVAVISAASTVDAGRSDSVTVTVEAAPVEPGVPASVTRVAGDAQTATVGSAVAVPPSVLVRDAAGSPVPGVSVTFAVTAGGGTVDPSGPVTTDAIGKARLSSWVLGTTAGPNVVRATLTDAPAIGASKSAVGTPGAAAAATSTVTANPTTLLADGSATSLLTVRLADAFGNALTAGGAAVSFDPPDEGTIGSLWDVGDGTYTATYTAGSLAGPVASTLRVDGASFGSRAIVTLEGAVVSVAIDPETQWVPVGDELRLAATVVTIGGVSRAVGWSSGDPSVAVVDPDTGVVTGVGSGDTTITATSTYDGTFRDSVIVKTREQGPGHGQRVGEWVEVATYLDYRAMGATSWRSAVGSARLQHLDMGRVTHTVTLEGLEPGTEYEFRLPYDPLVAYPTVIHDPTTHMTIHWQTHIPLFEFQPVPTGDAWRFRFRTFPAQLSEVPVRIGFGGDIKQSAQPNEIYAQVFAAYTAQDLHALVITGDWAYDDNIPFKEPYVGDNRFADLWDAYKLHGADGEGRLTPILPGIGNHEVAGGYNGRQYRWGSRTLGDNTVFASQFPAVPEHWFFATDIGDYASIVMLDSEHVSPRIATSGDRQTAWLAETLEAREHLPNVFVTYHVAAYPVHRTFSGGIPTRIRTHWHPLLDRHDNIKLVFEMHDHVYGESHWIRGGAIVGEGEGIKYLGAGHMGTTQDRLFWNPATTWYLKDAYGLRAKKAENGVAHQDDGRFYDQTGGRTRHIWIVELTEGERRVRSHMIDGTSRANFTF
jgi:uncharacterized protein YjdB